MKEYIAGIHRTKHGKVGETMVTERRKTMLMKREDQVGRNTVPWKY